MFSSKVINKFYSEAVNKVFCNFLRIPIFSRKKNEICRCNIDVHGIMNWNTGGIEKRIGPQVDSSLHDAIEICVFVNEARADSREEKRRRGSINVCPVRICDVRYFWVLIVGREIIALGPCQVWVCIRLRG